MAKPLSIAFDARLYQQTGVGTYIRSLLTCLQEYDLELHVIMLKKDEEDFKRRFPGKNIILYPTSYHWHTVAEQVGLAALVNALPVKLIHYPYFSYPVFARKPFISTVHDVIPLTHSRVGKASTLPFPLYHIKKWGLSYVFRGIVRNARHIITPSKTTAELLSALYEHTPLTALSVIYEGVDPRFTHAKPQKPATLPDGPYILSVSNFFPHKNIPGLLKAYAASSKKLPLVLVGPQNVFTLRVVELVKKLGLSCSVYFCLNASEGELLYLYKHAQALFQPSFKEGFGLPPLEALHTSTPVFASKIPIFDEILRNYYYPFNPYSQPSMTHALENAMEGKLPPGAPGAFLERYSSKEMVRRVYELYKTL